MNEQEMKIHSLARAKADSINGVKSLTPEQLEAIDGLDEETHKRYWRLTAWYVRRDG